MRLIKKGERHTVEEARELVARFLDANPAVSKTLTLRFPANHRMQCRGYYRQHLLTVFTEQATKPGTGYSWPGHISDRTLLGVTAHELGHHVHLTRPDVEEISKGLPGPAVTGYEPNDLERFAETFRIFLLNPDLLARGRPARYAFLTDFCGLRPIETRPWQEILAEAPARMTTRLPKWGLRGGATQTELIV